MFYVGAIDEKLNDKGYIVPGYINRRVNFNDSRTELEILVTGCSALESRRDKLAEVDRTTSQMIELMSTANLSIIYISGVCSRLPVYFSKHKIHSTDNSDNIR